MLLIVILVVLKLMYLYSINVFIGEIIVVVFSNNERGRRGGLETTR
jgi:hypothetical protein